MRGLTDDVHPAPVSVLLPPLEGLRRSDLSGIPQILRSRRQKLGRSSPPCPRELNAFSTWPHSTVSRPRKIECRITAGFRTRKQKGRDRWSLRGIISQLSRPGGDSWRLSFLGGICPLALPWLRIDYTFASRSPWGRTPLYVAGFSPWSARDSPHRRPAGADWTRLVVSPRASAV